MRCAIRPRCKPSSKTNMPTALTIPSTMACTTTAASFLSDVASLARTCTKNPRPLAELAEARAALYDAKVKKSTRSVTIGGSTPVSHHCVPHSPIDDIEFRGYIYAGEDAAQIIAESRAGTVERQAVAHTLQLSPRVLDFPSPGRPTGGPPRNYFSVMNFTGSCKISGSTYEKLNPLLHTAIEFLNAQSYGRVPAEAFASCWPSCTGPRENTSSSGPRSSETPPAQGPPGGQSI